MHQGNENGIARVRDVVVQDDAQHSCLGFLADLEVGSLIGSRTGNRARKSPESTTLVVEDFPLHQAIQRGRDDFVGTARGPFDPELSVRRFPGLGDLLERGVEQGVSGRRGIGKIHPVQITVDSILQRQIGDHGAGHDAGETPARHHLQVAALLVEHQEDQLFGEAYWGLHGRAHDLPAPTVCLAAWRELRANSGHRETGESAND